MGEAKLQIGEVAQLLGITPKTIRHYEALGLLYASGRTEGGYRYYGMAELNRLRHILRLQSLGLSLKQIQFILQAENPDALLSDVLRQREQTLAEDIRRLQLQQARIQAYLASGASLVKLDEAPPYSAETAMQAVIPSSGLRDAVLATEGVVLAQLDHYRWSQGYEAFWHEVAAHFWALLRPHEHEVILWLERYIALAELAPDDPQAQAWLAEFRRSRAPMLMKQAWQLAPSPALAPDEQARIEHTVQVLLLEAGNEGQRNFLRLCFGY